MRRVVTGLNQDGKSAIRADGTPPRVSEFARFHPGYRMHELWFTGSNPRLQSDSEDPTIAMDHFIPAGGETRFMIMELPPDAEIEEMVQAGEIDLEIAAHDFAQKMPDIAAANDPDRPGMHATDTIDYVVVISGEVWCELDNGAEIHLTPGQTLVQCGVSHAWSNKGDKPCIMACVMVGASR